MKILTDKCAGSGFARRLCLVLGFLSLTAAVQAQVAIQSISSSMQGEAEVVKVDLSDVLPATPTGFAVQSPARIALDFPAVVNATGKSSIEVDQANLQAINVVEAEGRTRMVLKLKRYTTYTTRIDGKTLYVSLAPVLAVPPDEPQRAFSQTVNRDALPLRNIDFNRGTDGSGRIVVTLPNDQVGVDIRQQGKALVVDFMKTLLPDNLRRRLDVTDFGTPVQTVTASQVGSRVRVVIEPEGNWVHSAYQSNAEFVIEIKPVKDDPEKLTPGPGYNGEKLSLNFQNIEVRSLLQVFADFTNFNIVTSDSVSGSVTLRLQNVPWDQALDIILRTKGLGMRKNGNVLWIAPKDEIDAKEKQELEAVAALRSLEPLRTQAFQMNYTKATEVATQLTTSYGSGSATGSTARMLSSRGSAFAEPRTNQLFVTDIASKLEDVQALIAKLDIPVRQVMIEARIVEASDGFRKALGVRLGGGRTLTGSVDGRPLNVAIGNTGSTGGTGAVGNFVNLPTAGTTGVLNLSVFGSNLTNILNLEISAQEADNKAKVISSPRLITADQIKAIIEQGVEIPYQNATSSGATAVSFRKATLKLEVTPQITPDGGVILELDVTKDTRGEETFSGPSINTKHIKTQVLVESGGTVVIGGIYTEDQIDGTDKVPLLGDIPGLGWLFKRNVKSTAKQEMLVFITPRVISGKTVQ